MYKSTADWKWENSDKRKRCYGCHRLFFMGMTNGGHFYCQPCWLDTWRDICRAIDQMHQRKAAHRPQ